MSQPYPSYPPSAVFSGALGDTSTGGWYPARAEVSSGYIILWTASQAGWTQLFSLPAHEVTVKSAAQRITLVVRGQSYPILAKPEAEFRSIGYGVAGTIANVRDKPMMGVGADVGRGLSQLSASAAFQQNGGPQFIAAARAAGARTSRIGYGPLLAIGCGGGVLAVFLVTVVTVFAFGWG